jgi:DNA-binding response OmpR family regulator
MPRVLVVDDDLDLVEACRLVLEDAGYTVEAITDARQTAAVARAWHPDILLLDWVLEGLTGDEVLRELRRDPALATVPVVVMSALEGGDRDARGALADDYLAKPFQVETLVARLDRTLARARMQAGHPAPT